MKQYGLACGNATDDDFVFQFVDCDITVVIRQVGSNYKLIGKNIFARNPMPLA